jgi:hypothetical protein
MLCPAIESRTVPGPLQMLQAQACFRGNDSPLRLESLVAAGIERPHAGSCAFAVLHADPRHPCSYIHRVHTACAPVSVPSQAPPCFSLRVKVQINIVSGYAAQRPVCVCSHAGRPQPSDLPFPPSRPFSLPFCRTLDIFPFPLLSPFSPSLGDGCLNTRTRRQDALNRAKYNLIVSKRIEPQRPARAYADRDQLENELKQVVLIGRFVSAVERPWPGSA